jgi:amino acid transporter
MIVPSQVALASAQYLSVIWPGENPHLMGSVILVVIGFITLLTIRINTRITGAFVALELLVLLGVTVLGFTHVHQSPKTLIAPRTFDVSGQSFPLTVGSLLAGVALGVFGYDGYQNAVVYSEETTGRPQNVARAIFWSLTIAMLAELLAIVAVLMGAPSLSRLVTAPAPTEYFVTAVGGGKVDTIIGLGVALALLNATLAVILSAGRILYSSGRDIAWPQPISTWLAAVHPRLRTPWVATASLAVVGASITAISNLATLVTFAGVTAVVHIALVALSALVSRRRQPAVGRPYRMPIWPFPPLIALAGLVVVATQQKPLDVVIVACIVTAALIYYVAYLFPRRGRRWVMLDPTTAEKEASDGLGHGPPQATS